jgi:hypothetical protein
LADKVKAHVAAKNRELVSLFGAAELDPTAVATQFVTYARRLQPHLVESSVFIDETLRRGGDVLAEGAQGTFLDIDHGTYPFVTSSSPTAGGVLTGLGVGPRHVRRVIGIAKAFTSRVGSGPFPSELDGEMAARLRGTGEKPWDEYGTTTGRARRVGWLDMVMLRHAVRINGLTEIVLTKLDILSGLPEIKVCVAYEVNGRRLDHYPTTPSLLDDCTPIYETLPGWEKISCLPVNSPICRKMPENMSVLSPTMPKRRSATFPSAPAANKLSPIVEKPMTQRKIALLSVSDKTGLLPFAQELSRLEFDLLASGGTARLLARRRINCAGCGRIYRGAGDARRAGKKPCIRPSTAAFSPDAAPTTRQT